MKLFFSKRQNRVVGITVNFENMTFRIDTIAKISLYSNFGLLNLNILLVFAYVDSVANFRVARYRKLGSDGNPGHTEAMSKNKCQIWIHFGFIFDFFAKIITKKPLCDT